jgi:ubiquinone/menaquinone biosynthesis C-methylase UbiE
MAPHEQWQLQGSAPELYQQYLVPIITAVWAADLVQRAAPRPNDRILDLACGTGVVARLAAERLRDGRVAGLDINAGMLALARSTPQTSGPAIAWHEGSALDMPFPDADFDLVLCQLGLQFFPQRPVAVAEIARVLAPGGRLALSVFSAIENNPAPHALANALDQRVGNAAAEIKRSEHVLADTAALRQLIEGAGFKAVTIETVTQTIHFPSVREYVRIQLAATPIAGLLQAMGGDEREALVDALTGDMTAALPAALLQDGFSFPQEVHVLMARR